MDPPNPNLDTLHPVDEDHLEVDPFLPIEDPHQVNDPFYHHISTLTITTLPR